MTTDEQSAAPDVGESARRLRAARERAGLSQREAAERLGVHFGSLNRYEKGRMRVPADLLMRAEALSTDPPTASTAPPLHEPSFWHGRMVTVLELIEAAGREVRGLVESGVLVQGAASPTGRPTAAGIAAPEMTEAEFVREMQRRGYPRPDRLPAAG